MTHMKIELDPIGILHSPFTTLEGMPIQPVGGKGIKGTVEVFKEYEAGLKDLEGFSHIILIYYFHKSGGYSLSVTPFLDTQERGVFATRAPKRPNAIGISVVKLDQIEGRTLYIENIDILDGTPLLDIKPYVPGFEAVENIRQGWLENSGVQARAKKADKRFT